MASVLAQGQTTIVNPAQEPEIACLIKALLSMGAKITENPDHIRIQGVPRLRPLTMRAIPDRIESATFIAAVAGTGGEIRITDCDPSHLSSIIEKFREIGVKIKVRKNTLHVKRNGALRHTQVSTAPYPGFPTDMQAQIIAVLSLVPGTSIITDTIFHDRFTHVAELKRLGADISLKNNTAVVNGIKKLKGAPVMATDLRASAALVIAGLMASDRTIISRIYHIDRGYESIEGKFTKLGADIKRIKEF
jgi:UDP-N-acetylglucosamine 1-carboxyvinyltransferase